MARGLRDYLIRLAEDDGALIRDSDDPAGDLLCALGAHPNEAELVRGAIGLLQRDGFLGGSSRSLFVCNLPAAQAWEPRIAATAPETPSTSPSSSSSKERVRRHRERRAAAAALLARSIPTAAESPSPVTDTTDNVVDAVTSPVTGAAGNVTDAGTSPVTASRGSRNLKSSESLLDLQRDKQIDLLPSSARADGVTRPETSAVASPVTADTAVTAQTADDEDEGKFIFRRSAEEPLTDAISARATAVRDRPALATVTHPERWPEVLGVAQTLARSLGLPEPRLGQYDRDPGVRAVVELYAAGFTQRELERVAEIVPKQPWWSAPGKRLGLSSLSIEVVRRNLPGIGPSREASPSVAKVLAGIQKRREAG